METLPNQVAYTTSYNYTLNWIWRMALSQISPRKQNTVYPFKTQNCSAQFAHYKDFRSRCTEQNGDSDDN